ncbi:unnamed protein product [Trypanosoma congolense IL3000]|uniref:WGS project CAEQ00000000 data, annotated contig 423 n=1 Tax=Trypanosoma congolense (strain IL3000) TaxID=1068625 RepID=F9WFS8_TRYCI|nr:unnamed protein product [Trypanosoma congolense IL3000]
MKKLMMIRVFGVAVSFFAMALGSDSACQLDKKEVGALCALATALEAMYKIAEKYEQHYLKEASENMTGLKSNFDQSKRALLETLDELEKINTYYTLEERMLLGVVVVEVARENENLYRAFEEASTHFREHWDKAKTALKKALGKKGEGSSVNCRKTQSTLSHFIRCHVTGGHGTTPTTVPLGTVCEGQDYSQHMRESTGDAILEIPLEVAWRRWGGLRGEQESSKRPACPSTTHWENSIILATQHMKDLAEVAQRTEATRNQSVASLAFLTALRRGVESGENMKKIAHDVKVAVLPGAFTTVKTNRQTTEDGRTTVILERRVQVAEMNLATIFQHYLEGSRNTTQSLNLWVSVLVCLGVVVVVEIARRRTMNGPGEYNTTTAQQHPVEELSKFCVDGGTHHGGSTSEAHPKQEAVHTHREAILTRVFPCPHPLCKKMYASPEEVEKHIRDDHLNWEKPGVDEMRLLCPFCLANCDSYKIMIAHMKDGHWDEKNNYTDSAGMKCRYCEERFRSYGKLQEHIKEDHPGKPALDDDMVVQSMQFKCYHCDEMCSSYMEVKTHIQDNHPDQPQPYTDDESKWVQCSHPLCKQKFPSYEEMKRHIRDDHMDKQRNPGADEMMFVCPLCDKKEAAYKEVIHHMKFNHTDESWTNKNSEGMKCRYCEKSFRSYGDVVKHIEKDHPGKPALDDDMVVQRMQFKCLQCEKTLPSNEKRRVHMRDHRKPTRAEDFHDETDQQ